jgi:hypothetical protein
MSTKHGKSAALWLGDADVSTHFRSMEFGADIDTAETSTFGSSWKTHVPGMAGATVETEGLYDPAFDDITSIITAPSGAVLTTGPAGLAEGDNARLTKVLTTAYAESSPVGDVVAFTWGVLADGQVGLGKVIHAFEQETASGSGNAIDLGTAAAGAIAHLHVAAVSSTDTLNVLIEDSADGSTDWQTVFDFTDATGPTAERLSITGTVRRYVRATWTITGSGSTDATFAVAIARA